MQQSHEVLGQLLDRVQERLTSLVSLAQLNATLSVADPGLLLPTPAVGILQAESDVTSSLPAGVRFVVPGDRGADSRLVLCPMVGGLEIHPWRVASAKWLDAGSSGSDAAADHSGLRLQLQRSGDGPVAGGWLTLLFRGHRLLSAALNHTHVDTAGRRLRMRRCSGELRESSTRQPFRRAVVATTESLLCEMRQVYLPPAAASDTELLLDLYFQDPLPAMNGCAGLTVTSNVIPVWNSVEDEYPGLRDAEQRVSESRHRLLHPLADTIGDQMGSAWSVASVYSSSGHVLQRGLHWSTGGGDAHQEPLQYALVLVPSDGREKTLEDGSLGTPTRLSVAVLLTPHTRRYLDLRGAGLRVRFRRTLGARGNGLPTGTRLVVECPQPGSPLEKARVHLIGRTWGGADGLAQVIFQLSNERPIGAVLDDGRHTVGDVADVFDHHFGDLLSVVDEYDLVRLGSDMECSPLTVRVRFKVNLESEAEKRPILQACEDFLGRYLAASRTGPVYLKEIADE